MYFITETPLLRQWIIAHTFTICWCPRSCLKGTKQGTNFGESVFGFYSVEFATTGSNMFCQFSLPITYQEIQVSKH